MKHYAFGHTSTANIEEELGVSMQEENSMLYVATASTFLNFFYWKSSFAKLVCL